MGQLLGHTTKTTKVCGGNYQVESSIGTFSVHKLEGRWYARLRGCGLIAIRGTKAQAMGEVRDAIRDQLSGAGIRYLREATA